MNGAKIFAPNTVPALLGVGPGAFTAFARGLGQGMGLNIPDPQMITPQSPRQPQSQADKIMNVHIIGTIPLPVYIVGGSPSPIPTPQGSPPSPLPPTAAAQPTPTPQGSPSGGTSHGLPASFFGPWNTFQHGLTPPEIPDWQASPMATPKSDNKAVESRETNDTLVRAADSLEEVVKELKRMSDQKQTSPGLGEGTTFTPGGPGHKMMALNINPRAVPRRR